MLLKTNDLSVYYGNIQALDKVNIHINEGEIVSCDLHEKKLRLIESGAKRLGIGCIKSMAADASQLRSEWQNAFDLVIADVPCSGFGVMRKKPEIRMLRIS